MDFLGNISLRLVGVLCTVAIMAAAYFFFVKPTLDTTSKAIDSVSDPIREATQQAKEAQSQLQQSANQQGGSAGKNTQIDIGKLQNCVQKAGQDVNALQACTAKFGP